MDEYSVIMILFMVAVILLAKAIKNGDENKHKQ